MARKKSIKQEISPEEALIFLENMRILNAEKNELTKLISIRVPENILRAVKLRAKIEGKKYQSLIVEYIRKGLKQK
jgi:predicted DNA binding CopG/RHH family protein